MSLFASCRLCAARVLAPASSRSFASTSILSAVAATSRARAERPVPPPRDDIDSPASFLKAISKLPRRDLANDTTCSGALGEDWKDMFHLRGQDLKGKGVPVKQRRYILWALERFRQGEDPKDFAYQPKPKKKVRGWGPRVQKGIRVSGRRRPGEK